MSAVASGSLLSGSRGHRLLKLAAWIGGIALLVLVLDVVDVDVGGWLQSLWDALTSLSTQTIVAAGAFQIGGMVLTSIGWWAILRAGYPEAKIPYRAILAAYAAGVAMNCFLPANLGTFASLLMYEAIVVGATFTGVLGGMVVQKIFFTAAGAFVYLYLILSAPRTGSAALGGVGDNWPLTVAIIVGGIVLIVLLCLRFKAKIAEYWRNAKQGGAILAQPRRYLLWVALPSFGAWLIKLGTIALFLGAYSIPVTFHTVMSVMGGNSVANTVSATPGGVGVNQAANIASLRDVTDTATATAYSVSQQLVTSFWNILFAIALVVWAFGWSGGRSLVEESYAGAKTKLAEKKAESAARKQARPKRGRRDLVG